MKRHELKKLRELAQRWNDGPGVAQMLCGETLTKLIDTFEVEKVCKHCGSSVWKLPNWPGKYRCRHCGKSWEE